MLQLGAEQLDQVERLQARRQAESVALVLAQAWPDVAERLQARWPAFVAASLERARELGLTAPADLARYASLCCLWGVGFEARPGFEWAQEIVGDARRGPALRLHQLLHGSREALARAAAGPGAAPSAGALTPAFLDQALGVVAAGMAQQQQARTVFLDLPGAPPLQACDLDTLALALVEPHPLQAYQRVDGQWRRVDQARLGPEPLHWTPGAERPAQLPVLSRAPGAGAGARLNLAVQTLGACNPLTHPEVTHRSAQGPLTWRGPDTARLSLALHAPAAAPSDPQRGPPGMAWAVPPDRQALRIGSCGARDAGAPFGDVDLALPVYPATQHLLEVSHQALPKLSLPATAPAASPTPTSLASCRLQADGVAIDTTPWAQAWRSLQTQCQAGLEKLFNAWARAMAATSAPQLEAELSPLTGQAGITWGWQRNTADSVAWRVEGLLQWVALAADIQLSGELAWEGATAQLQLRAQGRSEWTMHLRQCGADAAEGEGLADAHTQWRHPFVLSLVALASGEPAMLSALPLPDPLQGALVGECGLRPRADGQGWQWYYRLGVEAVQVALLCTDPLLGEQRCQRELLPAMTLVDWSAG
jgi:hypothetical protein